MSPNVKLCCFPHFNNSTPRKVVGKQGDAQLLPANYLPHQVGYLPLTYTIFLSRSSNNYCNLSFHIWVSADGKSSFLSPFPSFPHFPCAWPVPSVWPLLTWRVLKNKKNNLAPQTCPPFRRLFFHYFIFAFRTSLGVSFLVRRTSFRDLVACQENNWSRKSTGIFFGCSFERLGSVSQKATGGGSHKSSENFVGLKYYILVD